MVTVLSRKTIVGDLLQEHPECVQPFLGNNMLCVGCPVARFHDIGYACEKHGVSLSNFMERLKEVAIHSPLV